MQERTAPTPVAHPLLDVRLWCTALFGGFVLGALPFSLLGLFWAPLAGIALVTWPIAVAGILYLACQEQPRTSESVGVR